MGIGPCKKGDFECQEDVKRFREIIKTLSAMHILGKKDPEDLCMAIHTNFKRSFQNMPLILKLQGELYDIARRHNLPWARI